MPNALPPPAPKCVCPECLGDGFLEVEDGYRITGRGFGDAVQKWRSVECDVCEGTGMAPEADDEEAA